MEKVIYLTNLFFTNYFIVLTFIIGIILGIIFPPIYKNTKYAREYKLAKYIGFFYMFISVLMGVVKILF